MHLAGGSLIFLSFVVVYCFIVAHALYGRTGSAINPRLFRKPYAGAGDAKYGTRQRAEYIDEVEVHLWSRGTR